MRKPKYRETEQLVQITILTSGAREGLEHRHSAFRAHHFNHVASLPFTIPDITKTIIDMTLYQNDRNSFSIL